MPHTAHKICKREVKIYETVEKKSADNEYKNLTQKRRRKNETQFLECIKTKKSLERYR